MLKFIEYGDYVTTLNQFDDKEKRVKTLTFQVTNSCNLKCSYCYQINKSSDNMNLETAKLFIDIIFNNLYNENYFINIYNTSGLVIEFIGGEPLLQISLIEQIIEYFEYKLYLNPECPWVVWHKYSLCSNGVEYFNENFQNLLKKYKNFLSVSITVDGTQEMHDKCRIFHNGTGSYDLAMKAALHNLKNNNIKSTKITLSNENLHNAFDAVKHMLENGFIEININCIFEDVWDNSIHPKILYYEIKKMADYVVQNDLIDKCFIRFLDPYAYNDYNKDAEDSFCGASRAMLSLDPKGDIFPCIRFMESSLGKDNEPLKIGDIKFGIGATELDLSNLKTISSVTNQSNTDKLCQNCPIQSGCASCLGFNYQINKDPSIRTKFHCKMHKAAAAGCKYYLKLIKDFDSYNELKLNKEFLLDIGLSEKEINALLNFN